MSVHLLFYCYILIIDSLDFTQKSNMEKFREAPLPIDREGSIMWGASTVIIFSYSTPVLEFASAGNQGGTNSVNLPLLHHPADASTVCTDFFRKKFFLS